MNSAGEKSLPPHPSLLPQGEGETFGSVGARNELGRFLVLMPAGGARTPSCNCCGLKLSYPMKTLLIQLLLASGLLFFGGPTLFAADTSSLLNGWFAAQTNFHTWSADTVQTRRIQSFAQPLVSTGKVWVAMPQRFRWELGKPPQTIAIRQPDQLILLYPRLKRAEKYPLKEGQPGPWRDALALLDASFPRSRAELESRFTLISAAETNGVVQVELRPKSAFARKFMSEIKVGFRLKDYTPVSTDLIFTDGSSMRNDFSNSVLNPPLPDSLFTPEIGPDYKVVEPLKE